MADVAEGYPRTAGTPGETVLSAEVHYRTAVGLVRRTNEDSLSINGSILHCSRDCKGAEVFDAEMPLSVVVCDGMGGHAGGGLASQTVARFLARAILEAPAISLNELIKSTATALADVASAKPELSGMGTTAAAISILGDGTVRWFNVGDSRIYRVRPSGQFRQISLDHVTTPGSSVLTQAFGGSGERPPEPWSGTDQAHEGLGYLLCSDGLTAHLSSEEIAEIVLPAVTDNPAGRDPGGSLDALVDRALARGGADNITVVLVVLVSKKRGAFAA